jgi:hypothetical protein
MTKRFSPLIAGLTLVGALSVSPHIAATAAEDDANKGGVGSSVVAHPLGEHPAVIVQRRYAKRGYDYASKFYPHPAWLWLYSEAPRPMMDHPAVIIAKGQKKIESQGAMVGATPALMSAVPSTPQP